MMKQYCLLLSVLLLFSCGDKVGRTILPLEIDISIPTSSDVKVKESFLQNVSKYQLTFTGKFGKRRAELLSKNDGSKYLVENKWGENQVLAIGETSESVNWVAGRAESIKIICKLTQIGEDTHEEILNV